MKNTFINRIFTHAFFVFSFALTATAQQEAKQTKPVVMIVGSYHMANPGRDMNNVTADDVRHAKRQKEIADFVEILKKFKPTKIAVEQPIENHVLNERYNNYLNGKYDLTANEVDQIGFRTAKEMNLKEVTTIDEKGDFNFDKVVASAKANNEMPFAEAMMSSGKAEVAKLNGMMKTATVTEIFTYLNDAKTVDRWHSTYLKIARVGAGKDFAGAELTGDWYARNLKIYANLTRLAAAPNERILVIYGAGHLKTLQDFVEQSGEFELERLSKYL